MDSNAKYLPDCTLVQYSIDNSYFTFMNVHGDEGQALFNISFVNPGYHFINLETKKIKTFYIIILSQFSGNSNENKSYQENNIMSQIILLLMKY